MAVLVRTSALLAALAAVFACSASASGRNWAAPQIKAVINAGVLGSSPSTFAPEAPLTQSALAGALQAADALQHPPLPAPPPPAPVTILSTIGSGAVIGGVGPTGPVTLELEAPNQTVDRIDLAVDGTEVGTALEAPYQFELDTSKLADGPHQLAVNVSFEDGGYAIAVWSVTVATAPGSVLTAPAAPSALPIAKSRLSTTAAVPAQPAVRPLLYRALVPTRPVSVKQLDAALVGYLGLGAAAREIQDTLQRSGLRPPPNTGTEAVARMLGLRLNHPAAQDDLELLPSQAATRAEAAFSLAQLLHLGDSLVNAVQQKADAFTLPDLTSWQRRILTTAVHYVGYPYIWGGTSPTAETLFGVHSAGGFDCSGFVWRVYKLTPYAGEGRLAGVLRGRTTYQMSGEVPHRDLIPAAKLLPADVMFFGADGPNSHPSEVDHTALYLGNGWFVQSSDEGVTVLPFSGSYASSYAWGRRPLREAGLTG
jgi:cell wall-associated NlpC family hydrolase